MDIFGVGPLELLFILLIALVVIGPKDLGKHARAAGRFLNKLYRSETWKMLTETSRNLRSLPNRLAREAALDELDEVQHSLNETRDGLAKEVRTLEQGLKAWTTPPTPASDAAIEQSSPEDDPDTPQPSS